MDDTKRLIIAFALVFLILLLWQFLFRTSPPTQPAQTITETEKTKTEPADTVKPKMASLLESQKPMEPALPEIETVLENDVLRLVFTSRGGKLKSVWVKRYNAELVPEGGDFFATSLLTDQGELDLANLTMRSKATDSMVEYETDFILMGENRKIKKVFSLNKDYSLYLTLSTQGVHQGWLIRIDQGLSVTEPNLVDDLAHFRFYCKAGKEINGYPAKKIRNGLSRTDNLDWVGLRSKYFLLSLVSQQVKFDTTSVKLLPDNRISLITGIKSNESNFLIFLGPLKYELLKSYGLGFEQTVELGWPKPFSYAILKILGFLFRIVKNYGVAVIIFSVLMKAIFWPLTQSSTKQMRQMQLLQPKLDELKKRYKNDPQTLNRETMQLYRLYRINPFSGCLPLIIQLPIFWALYSVLRSTIDLRRAGFIFWLRDLSLKDPYYILPILMGVSFLAQNLLTSADKRNMALSVFMPIFLTVIFLNFPSGLQLYWFTYNILSILESVVARKGGIRWRRQPVHKPQTSLTN